MIKKISGTVLSKLFNALVSFLALILYSQYLGVASIGTISLIILGITFMIMVNDFVGGNGLVYLIPRINLSNLIWPAYLWVLVNTLLFYILFMLFPIVPKEYVYHTLVLGGMYSFSSIHYKILLGLEKIKRHNWLMSMQYALFFIALNWFIFIEKRYSINSFLVALFISYLVTWVATQWAVLPCVKFGQIHFVPIVFKQLFVYGSLVQLAGIAQLLNNRVSYYVVDSLVGREALGKYAVGVQLSEAIWLVAGSMAMVQYATISNLKDKATAVSVSIILLNSIFYLTLMAIISLLVLPSSFFVFLFGIDFIHIKPMLYALSPGILAISVSMIFSHYFSGIGKQHHNLIGSLIGLGVVVVCSLVFVQYWGVIGVAWATSISYMMGLLYQLIVFKKSTSTPIPHLFLPWAQLYAQVKQYKSI